jgi:uncharacterized membrane protein YozB (DUF420 family)
MDRLTAPLKAIPLWVVFVVVGVLTVLSYQPAREVMISQYVWIIVQKSPVTVNLALLLFLWGVTADRWGKNKTRWKGWMLWGVGFCVIIMVYTIVGGYDTIFSM